MVKGEWMKAGFIYGTGDMTRHADDDDDHKNKNGL